MNEALRPARLTELAYTIAGPLLATDFDGRLLHANPAAQGLLARTAILSVANGVLSARRREDERALRTLLQAVAEGAAGPVTACLRSREGQPTLVLDGWALEQMAALRLTELTGQPAPDPARLRAVFGFTPAEARVASGLLAGEGIAAMAERFGVEAETVRTQVKRMRGKTGARSVTGLLAMLGGLG